MRTKATLFLTFALILSVLVIVCELPTPSYHRALAQSVVGASPQATGRQAHRVLPFEHTVSSSLRPPCDEGPAEWGTLQNRAAAPLASARKTSLRYEANPGRLAQRSEYDSRTGSTGKRAISGVAKAPTIVLVAIMLVVILIVARRRLEAARIKVLKAAKRPAKKIAVPLRLVLALVQNLLATVRPRPLPRPGKRLNLVQDQIAEWERVRLVPT